MPPKGNDEEQAESEDPAHHGEGMITQHEAFYEYEVDAVAGCVEKDEEVAEGMPCAAACAVYDEPAGTGGAEQYAQNFVCGNFFTQQEYAGHQNENGRGRHDKGSVDRAGEPEPLEEHELIDCYAKQAAEGKQRQVGSANALAYKNLLEESKQ